MTRPRRRGAPGRSRPPRGERPHPAPVDADTWALLERLTPEERLEYARTGLLTPRHTDEPDDAA